MSDVLKTDLELVEACLAGDGDAFTGLYDRYAGLVRMIAFGASRDQSTIDDLVQETFLRAFKNMGKLRRPNHFPAWLSGIARQVVKERFRKRHFDSLVDDVPEKMRSSSTDLHELVARLPEKERIAINLFFLNEEDVKTTALHLQRSRAGTYLLIKQGLSKLAKWWNADESEKVKS